MVNKAKQSDTRQDVQENKKSNLGRRKDITKYMLKRMEVEDPQSVK